MSFRFEQVRKKRKNLTEQSDSRSGNTGKVCDRSDIPFRITERVRENACELSRVYRSVLSSSELTESREEKLTETCRSVTEDVGVEAIRFKLVRLS